MTDNPERLAEFFRLENGRDWEPYRAFLHPEVEWILCSTDGRQAISGIDAYMEKIRSAYAGHGGVFVCRELFTSQDGNRIAAVLENDCGDVSVDVFDFENGLIRKEYEYLL